MANPISVSRTNRNLFERERRSQLRVLLSRLFTLLPPHPTKMSMPELVEHATVYVKQLQERVEELKRRKVQAEGEISSRQAEAGDVGNETMVTPVLEITESESAMEVSLIAGTGKNTALCDIITILEEEGAEVVKVNYHNDGNRILLSVHSQAAYSRIGIESSRVRERLTRLQISSATAN
ncbi:hypothetical protein V6N13_115454 [Hibiscus sabdariffa]|uniref:BHLH domain-containing protein n=1 Tax=Hibiscus sabdariffa TaxID=183260 RepID=A0ABR2CRS7_9ROSI